MSRPRPACGTDGGYYRHLREGIPFPEDENADACGCRKAHAAAGARYARRRKEAGVPLPKPASSRCPDCGGECDHRSKRCRACAARARRAAARRPEDEPPIVWVTVRGIKRAVNLTRPERSAS